MSRPDLIDVALEEDMGRGGDVTSLFFVPATARARARAVARGPCVLAGMETVREVFARVDARVSFHAWAADGEALAPGSAVFEAVGPARSILTAERTALNFLQRLSGVATLARQFVQAVAGTGARILDTRKTTPGLRALEKAAAAAGGALNHRFGLHDQFLVKDNHLALRGAWQRLPEAVRQAKAAHPELRIEVEVDTLEQFRIVNAIQEVDIILLDNMSLDQLREAVALRRPGVLLEASGGITLQTARAIAETGVDFLSVGAITHSAPAADFSLEFAAE